MRTTLGLDDDLLTEAESYTGIREKSALVRERQQLEDIWKLERTPAWLK